MDGREVCWIGYGTEGLDGEMYLNRLGFSNILPNIKQKWQSEVKYIKLKENESLPLIYVKRLTATKLEECEIKSYQVQNEFLKISNNKEVEILRIGLIKDVDQSYLFNPDGSISTSSGILSFFKNRHQEIGEEIKSLCQEIIKLQYPISNGQIIVTTLIK